VQALDELNEAIADLIHHQQMKNIWNERQRLGLGPVERHEDIVIPIQKVR
jgi:hypothetical protein